MSDSCIQHKPTQTTPSGFGFDDDGERVPVVEQECPPEEAEEGLLSEQDERRVRQETIVRLFTRLVEGDSDAESVGRKVLVLSYLLKRCPGAPRSLAELGARMGVTKGRASQIVSALNPKTGGFRSVLG